MTRPTAAFLLAAVLAPGCATAPWRMKHSGPVTSAEGVSVFLLGERCERDIGGSRRSTNHQFAIKLRLDNGTAEPLVFRPAFVRLHIRKREIAVTAPPSSSRIDPWKSRELVLGFLLAADCSSRFQLDFDGALQLADRKVVVPLLDFAQVDSP